jgi:hypothetical protein
MPTGHIYEQNERYVKRRPDKQAIMPNERKKIAAPWGTRWMWKVATAN